MSYENEVQQAWRRLGPLGERETCEIARNADTQIAALRAELERKDAVILNLYQFAEHSDACWRDEVSRDRPCVCGLDNALKEADAALQPKEPNHADE